MFSFGFHHKAMVISTADTCFLNCSNIDELRHLVIQLLPNPSKKIILDLKGIEGIDESAMIVLERLHKLTTAHGVHLQYINFEPGLSIPCDVSRLN